MEVILAAIKLLTRTFEVLKAYLSLRKLRYEKSDHNDACKHRPKHLRE